MRIAVLADVHGNAVALRAVLADVDRAGCDGIVLAGDYAFFGPRPRECVDLLAALGVPAVVGNTDEYLLGRGDRWQSHPLLAWTRDDLGAEGLAWLETCAEDHRPAGNAELLVVHANPRNTEDLLIVEEGRPGGHARTTDAEARRLLADVDADLVVFGHIHYASEGTLLGVRVASVGSVGLPFDGDPRAAWAVATRDAAGRWSLDHRRVAYDHENVAREIEAQGLPLAAARAARLRRAAPVPLA